MGYYSDVAIGIQLFPIDLDADLLTKLTLLIKTEAEENWDIVISILEAERYESRMIKAAKILKFSDSNPIDRDQVDDYYQCGLSYMAASDYVKTSYWNELKDALDLLLEVDNRCYGVIDSGEELSDVKSYGTPWRWNICVSKRLESDLSY